MQIKFFSSFFATARTASNEIDAQPVKTDPIELSGAELPQVAGGLGPAGTWAMSSTSQVQGPAGTW